MVCLYFGSVRFFKHLILTVTALLIIVPTVMCIILAVDNAKKSAEIDRLNSCIDELSQSYVPIDESSSAINRLQRPYLLVHRYAKKWRETEIDSLKIFRVDFLELFLSLLILFL